MLIETRNLTKQYREVTALNDCTLGVQQGEVFGLLGPNGAGKSTLLRLIMGYLRPTSGTATVDGLDTYHQSVDVHRRVTYLPGDVRLFRSMTARQLLDFFCRVRGISDRTRGEMLAEELDLDITARVSRMSTGMRQKLALVACLAAETPIIILDEPTANLDPNIRSRVGRLVRAARDGGRTVVFSSHVLSEVEESCDRVCILRSGQLVHTQTLAELRRQHRIKARLTAKLPEVPSALRDQLTIQQHPDGRLTMETPGELRPLLGWLGTLPIEEVHIEPVGLRAVYDRFHPPEDMITIPNTPTAPTASAPNNENLPTDSSPLAAGGGTT